MSKIYCVLPSQFPSQLILIENHSFLGLPQIEIIGLPSKEVSEAKTRIRSAFDTQGLKLLDRKWTINLSPSNLPKSGTHFDLGIALSLLSKTHDMPWLSHKTVMTSAEVGINGDVRSAGQTCLSIEASVTHELDILLLAKSDESRVSKYLSKFKNSQKIPDIYLISEIKDLLEISNYHYLRSSIPGPNTIQNEIAIPFIPLLPIHESILKWITCILGGHHHLMLVGPKGAGKTSLLEWISALQIPPSTDEIRYSYLLNEFSASQENSSTPWIRKIYPGISLSALRGRIRSGFQQPGEIAKANGGLLIADEFPELSRDVKEALRIPLENKTLTLQQASGSVTLQARFLFVATGNLCPCGKLSLNSKENCRCSLRQKEAYYQRYSGPLLDRIDIILGLCTAKNVGLHEDEIPTSSLQQHIESVQLIRNQSIERWGLPAGLLSGDELENILRKNADLRDRLKSWTKTIQSLRSRHKLMKIALTLSVMDQTIQPLDRHFFEASLVRPESQFDHLNSTC